MFTVPHGSFPFAILAISVPATRVLPLVSACTLLVTCAKIKNLHNYNGESIESSMFNGRAKPDWELKVATPEQNRHSIVHDQQFAQCCRTNMTSRKSGNDAWQAMWTPKRIFWRGFNENYGKAPSRHEPRFALIVR
jgi:hypothetical protein